MSRHLSDILTTDSRHLIANFNGIIFTNLIIGVSNLVSGIWLAKLLGPRMVGDYAIVLIAIGLLTSFLVPGFNLAVLREPARKEIVAAATFATLWQSLVVVVASGLMYGFSLWYDQATAVRLCLPGVFILVSTVVSFWMYLLAAPFEAAMNYRFLVRVRLVALAVSITGAVIAAEVGAGIYALVIRDLFASATALVLIGISSPIQLTVHEWRKGIGDLLQFAKGLWALNTLERLILRLDYAIVGMLLEKEALGVYFVVRGLIEGGLGFVVTPIQTFLYSFYCRTGETYVVAKGLLNKGLPVLGVGSLLAITGSYVMGPYFVSLVLGSNYRAGGMLIWGFVLYALSLVWFENIKVLTMAWNSHARMLLPKSIHLCGCVLLTYPLIQFAGLEGAGISAGLSAFGAGIFATWILFRCSSHIIAAGKVMPAFQTGFLNR